MSDSSEEENNQFVPAETLAKNHIKDQISKGSGSLSLENFQITDLRCLSGLQWEGLSEVDLNKNGLASIDTLNNFRSLVSIKASFNFIVEVNLNLIKLQELDLSNNYLKKFPMINSLPKLKKLNLNTNKIEEIRVEFKPPASTSLLDLDLGTNNILLPSPKDIDDLLERLKKFKNLKSLNVLGNASFDKDEGKIDQLVTTLTSLEYINYERASDLRKQIQQNNNNEALRQKEEKKGTGRSKKVDKANFYFPSLDTLVFNLERANTHPIQSLDYLRDLSSDVDIIVEHLEMVEQYFSKNHENQEIVSFYNLQQEKIETFMQTASIIIDGHQELEDIMLSILAKLSIIKFEDFGVRCFNTLQELMEAGKEMEDRVIDVLKKQVINKLQQQNPQMIPSSLLRGLYQLVNKTEKSDMLTGLFENCFPSWLRKLNDKINNKKKGAASYDNNEHFDSILAILAVAVKENQVNAEKAKKKNLIPLLSDILMETHAEHERYIHVLQTVQYLCLADKSNANEFIAKGIHENLMKNIKNMMSLYKKNTKLQEDDGQKETEEKITRKFITLSVEIDCFSGLLEADRNQRENLVKDPLVDELLQITSHFQTDPVLLTSICQFAKSLFLRDEIKNNHHMLEPKLKKMQNLAQLIPYLGMKKFPEVIEAAKRYHDSASYIDRDKVTQLQHLNDTVVQKLFIAIIELINFFCEESEKVGSPPIFDEVSQSLNEVGRETALFNCLEVPNDEVKLAVVACLNNVPLAEFDTEEIGTIIRLLSSYKNIGAGQTELVLAKIFWILTKLTKAKEEDSGKNFRIKFGERAITEALDILIRNQRREVDDEQEEKEKLALSISIIHFLKFTSSNHDLRRFMQNRNEAFKLALHSEENFSSIEALKYPIEIEETWIGRSLESLQNTLNGNNSIDPYNIVSFRILQRMSNVLMNKIDIDVEDPYSAGVDIVETLKTNYKKNLKERKEQEKTFWVDPPKDFFSKLQENQETYKTYCDQHLFFVSSHGIQILRMFLTRKVPSFEEYLKKEMDPQFEKQELRLFLNLEQKKEATEQKENEKKRKDEETKTGGASKKHKSDAENNETEGGEGQEQEKGLRMLRMALQKEELGSGYQEDGNILLGSQKKNVNVENITKRDHKQGVQNIKLRSLCISAFLRCLFASIEYSPDEKLRQSAIATLADEFTFRNLAQLCDTTGWIECNIGAKFLRVMRHIIKMPFKQSSEVYENISHYEMITIVIRKILQTIKQKIANEQQHPLTQEDKVLIYEVSATCALLCQQSSQILWSTTEVRQPGLLYRTRRTPQEKVVDAMISSLFPIQSIQTFIAIVFRDMKQAQKGSSKQKQGSQSNEGIEAFVKMKSDMTREHIKFFLGEYLARCKRNKYEILEAFMKGVVFDKSYLRESYLQEILSTMELASFRTAIEGYLCQKQLLFDNEDKERIHFIKWVELAFDKANAFKPRLILVTNKGVYIFKGSSSYNSEQLTPENLSHDGPKLEMRFSFDQVNTLVKFSGIIQKLQIVFCQQGYMKSEQNKGLSLVVPDVSSAIVLQELLIEACKENYNFLLQTDELCQGSLSNIIGIDKMRLGFYLTRGAVSKFAFYSESRVIPNMYFLAVTEEFLALFKENWSIWECNEDKEKINSILQMGSRDKIQKKNIPQAQKKAEERMANAIKNLFVSDLRLQQDPTTQVAFIEDRQPAVVIKYEGGKEERLTFLCDYSRHKFMELLAQLVQERNE